MVKGVEKTGGKSKWQLACIHARDQAIPDKGVGDVVGKQGKSKQTKFTAIHDETLS